MAGEAYKSNMAENPLHPEPSFIKPSTECISSLPKLSTLTIYHLFYDVSSLNYQLLFRHFFTSEVWKITTHGKRSQFVSVAVSVEAIKGKVLFTESAISLVDIKFEIK